MSGADPLDAMRELQNTSRPTRRSGESRRFEHRQFYLDLLRLRFHALRPLKVELGTPSRTVRAFLDELTAESACRLTQESEATAEEDSAHLRIAIDGSGERCLFADESGQPIASEVLLATLAKQGGGEFSVSTVVLEHETSEAIEQFLNASGVKTARSEDSRAAMFQAMQEHQADLGGGPSGRFWFGGGVPTADAVRAVAETLALLSGSDRPLSSRISETIVQAFG